MPEVHVHTRDDMIAFVAEMSGCPIARINGSTDVFDDLGQYGDDLREFLEVYAEEFGVDMSDHIWYFHNVEEGCSWPGSLFFKPPYRRVKRIPITIVMLTEFANQKKWAIHYPEHKIPKHRFDMWINFVVIVIPTLLMFGLAVFSCSRRLLT